MVEVRQWGNCKQILCDLVSSKDGMPFKKDNLRKVKTNGDGTVQAVDPQFVKVYFMGGGDFVYPSDFCIETPKVDGGGEQESKQTHPSAQMESTTRPKPSEPVQHY